MTLTFVSKRLAQIGLGSGVVFSAYSLNRPLSAMVSRTYNLQFNLETISNAHKIVKLKRALQCLARMSTNFGEFFSPFVKFEDFCKILV